jgi:peptidoglycan/xylan/chitin deacetylase (PgdA/CDA1 family)
LREINADEARVSSRAWVRSGTVGVCLALAVAAVAVEPGQFHSRGPSGAKRLALTFDDGPGPETEKFLKLLDRYGVKATFFMLGELAELRPQQVKDVAARGHEVASHTWDHTNYKEHFKKVQAKVGGEAAATAQSRKELAAAMRRAQAAIEKSAGARVALCRMPHGIDRPWVREAARDAGVALVNWTYGADWNAGSAAELTPGYVKAVQPGAILLFHDGGNKRAKSLEIVESVIRAAKQQGYEFVTVGQLLQTRPSAAGTAVATPAAPAPKATAPAAAPRR